MSLVLLAGCASVAHVEKDETVNFSRIKTFSWIKTSDTKSDSGYRVSDLTERNIRKAVNAELEKAGWRETKNRPDVLVSYDLLVERSVRETADPVYSVPVSRYYFNPYWGRWSRVYYPSRFMGYESSSYAVREGTMTITLMDAQTEKTIWQGWTTDEVAGRNLTSKEVQGSIRSIFRKFDVAQR
ncbi:DUF4136 domain-containing protein [Paraflavisolibacter sp. H34]|uniref:DUF4136 domain-containing protein n=1 Tax=Huijunlia imazamoxiresistens TaxID=3127457 RepID=UPI003019A592